MTESSNIPAQGQAVVVKHTGSHYLLSRLPEWNLFPAVLRGKVRLKGSTATNPVAVGDVVDYTFEEGMSVIDAIHPRKNYIIRRSANLSREAHIIAANLDHAYLIVTMAYPETKLAFVDRFLVTCEAYGVPVTIVINKRDLYEGELEDMAAAFKDIYAAAGYEILEVSAITGEGVEALRFRLAMSTTLSSPLRKSSRPWNMPTNPASSVSTNSNKSPTIPKKTSKPYCAAISNISAMLTSFSRAVHDTCSHRCSIPMPDLFTTAHPPLHSMPSTLRSIPNSPHIGLISTQNKLTLNLLRKSIR